MVAAEKASHGKSKSRSHTRTIEVMPETWSPDRKIPLWESILSGLFLLQKIFEKLFQTAEKPSGLTFRIQPSKQRRWERDSKRQANANTWSLMWETARVCRKSCIWVRCRKQHDSKRHSNTVMFLPDLYDAGERRWRSCGRWLSDGKTVFDERAEITAWKNSNAA